MKVCFGCTKWTQKHSHETLLLSIDYRFVDHVEIIIPSQLTFVSTLPSHPTRQVSVFVDSRIIGPGILPLS